jgi:hypothetical protein
MWSSTEYARVQCITLRSKVSVERIRSSFREPHSSIPDIRIRVYVPVLKTCSESGHRSTQGSI